MQILGAAGKTGAGKTIMIRHIAELLLNGTYGDPVLLYFEALGSGGMNVELKRLLTKEFEKLEQGGTETFVLIDDILYPNQVEQIHDWGGNVLFVCGDGRLKDLDAPHRKHESQLMANDYTAGKSTELFDFCITNHKTEKEFKKEVKRFMHLFLGGDASYEAGLF